MPSVKDFKKNQKVAKSEPVEIPAEETASEELHEAATSHKRRPGREKVEVHAETQEAVEAVKEDSSANEPATEDVSNVGSDKKKIEISFFGSEIIRAKLPKPFEIAETVATEWINDGNFEELQLGNPIADSAAIAGLKKAKEIEKKVIESGVIEKVAMQALTAGLKAQSEINNIRDQVRAKFGKK